MRIPSPRAQRRARIELIPLIDVIFFLLATFMMVSLSMIQDRGIPVRLPTAATGVPQERADATSIRIAADGGIYLEREKLDLDTLGVRLRALRAGARAPKVFIHGDEAAAFGVAIAVLDRVRAEGIEKVSIETRPRVRQEGH
jgi:biopolymer transport protein ExbD